MNDPHPDPAPHRPPRRRAVLAGLLAAPSLGMTGPARAQSAPLRIIVPGPPGGPTDVLARLIADHAQRALDRPVVVDNRAGAGGVIGTEAAARAAPDGNTVVVGHNQTHASNQWMLPRLPYNVVDSFDPVARLATVHHALVVPAASSDRTLADLIARGRAGRLTYASSQAGSASHVISETLARRNGMNATHVPYRGATPAVTDTVAGVVDFYVSTFPPVSGLVRDGRLRALAIGAPARVDGFPDLPTAAELGQGEPFVDAWFGVFAPRGTDPAAVNRLSAAALAALSDPAARPRLQGAGFNPAPLDPAAFAAFQREEVARWQTIVELTGIRMED